MIHPLPRTLCAKVALPLTLVTLASGCDDGPAPTATGPEVDSPVPAFLSSTSPVPIVDLGTLGGSFGTALAISDRGQVVGGSTTPSGAIHAFRWTEGGGMVDLGTLGGGFSSARAINNRGEIVGSSRLPSGHRRAVLWDAVGQIRDLGTLGGPGSAAFAIDGSGRVAGTSSVLPDRAAPVHAFLWTESDGMLDLGTLGGQSSLARAMNGRGQIVGQSDTPGSERSGVRAFLWSDGTMRNLGSPGAGLSAAVQINRHGQVIGEWHDAAGNRRAFRWTEADGIMDLGSLGGVFANALDIDGEGRVVGVSSLEGGGDNECFDVNSGIRCHAFLWTESEGMIDLGSLGGTLSRAEDINDRGHVVGWSTLEGRDLSTRHAFLWTEADGMIDLGTLGGPSSTAGGFTARGLNQRGQAVGFAATGDGERHAVLWKLAEPLE